MLLLRWFLGVTLAFLGGAFIILSIVASGFRKSFGASDNNLLTTVLPVAAMLLLLAGLIAPSNKILLHFGAVAAIGLLGFCVWQMVAELAIGVLWGVAYLLLWLYFYWRSISVATS